MTDKDPKDMTAAELLREADSNPCSMCHLVMTGDESCATTGCASWAYRLADKIDAELAEARELSLLRGAELWAKANGWPDFKEGEDFGAWLDRCTYKKPVDDCNEPVQFGDEIELHYLIGGADKGRFQEVTVNRGPVWMLSFTGVDHERLYRYDSECDILKRPAPEVLLGDGKPVSKGETVYVTDSGIERTVKGFGTKLCEGMDGWDGSPWVMFDNGSWMHARDLTHEHPVLGADGLTIKVGDTVWLVDEYSQYAGSNGSANGNEYSLLGVDSQETLFVEYDRLVVSGKNYVRLSTCNAWCPASFLTHTPPDTLERLRDDMYRTVEKWREADSVSIPDMNHWANRLTALIERMGGAE